VSVSVSSVPLVGDPAPGATARVGVVPGEGIGPSVVAAASRVLRAAAQRSGMEIDLVAAPELTERDDHGLRVGTAAGFYESCFAAGIPILHGPAGGRFVYELRAQHALPVKVTPVRPSAALRDASIVRPERLGGVDVLIVRDNAAGLYQGAFGWREEGRSAFQEAVYDRADVVRVIDAAVAAARARSGRLAVVTKPGGVPAISELWRRTAEELVPDGIELEFLEIDNACFQLVSDPRRFDVVAAPNMFGDVVGDTAALVLGSRGMSYSANFGAGDRAVYQTAHGAAHDLAGRDRANPVAQILTLAWLVRRSLRRPEVAAAIEDAVESVLADGFRTPDVAAPGSRVVGTDELADRIAARVAEG
jgi:3-isopropylmalate dehydrogenase